MSIWQVLDSYWCYISIHVHELCKRQVLGSHGCFIVHGLCKRQVLDNRRCSVLLLPHCVVAVPPGVAMMRKSIFGGDVSVIDPRTGKKNIKYYLDVEMVSRNSKVYSMLLVFALFEPMLLQFLPWWKTGLSELAEFPTLPIFPFQDTGFQVYDRVSRLSTVSQHPIVL